MRIVAGTLRGRSIDAPDGKGTRPTTDRVREALFSSLYSVRGGFEGAVVLDAFAGSGALGIEALSRGAAFALFCENDAAAAKTLEGNIRSMGLGPGSARALRRDVLAGLPKVEPAPFDLVFLDPPYALDARCALAPVRALAEDGRLSADAIIVYEHDVKAGEAVSIALGEIGCDVRSPRKYGKTGVTMGIWRESSQD